MKKFLALLLAMMMIFTVTAFAEEAEPEETAVPADQAETVEETILDYSIAMDEVPEGYTQDTVYNDGVAFVAFYHDSDDFDEYATYLITVSPSEDADAQGITTLTADMCTEEFLNAMLENYNGDMANPSISVTATSHGTCVIRVDDEGSEGDECILASVYEGYIISMDIWKNGEITEDEVNTGLKILSDMWVVENK